MSDPSKESPRVAVALHYEEGSLAAPRVVAKGRGFVAEKIIELAEENGVLVETNPVLAQALSGVELDDEIPVELYEAMAVVIGYVLKQSKR